MKPYLINGILGGVQSDYHIYTMLSERLHTLVVRLVIVDLIDPNGIDKECLHQGRIESALLWHCKGIVCGSWRCGAIVAIAIYYP